MPSLTEALKLEPITEKGPDGAVRFRADLSEVWTVGGKPHGGYLLALVTSACSIVQKGTTTPDPAHLMTSFLVGCQNGPAEIHVKVIRNGKSWTNLEAKILQKEQVMVSSQVLYTSFPELPQSDPHPPFSTSNQYLLPLSPSPYAKRLPLMTHPSLCDPAKAELLKHDEPGRRWGKNDLSGLFFIQSGDMEWVEDEAIKKRRESQEGGRGLEWGSWCELNNEDGEVTTEMLPFFADIMSSIPELLPEGQKVEPHYYPTLVMSVQFHSKLPFSSSSPYLSSPTTFGIYSTGHHIQAGRHEQLTEVWSSPSRLGNGNVQDRWRDRSMLLTTSTQLALSVDVMKLFGGSSKL